MAIPSLGEEHGGWIQREMTLTRTLWLKGYRCSEDKEYLEAVECVLLIISPCNLECAFWNATEGEPEWTRAWEQSKDAVLLRPLPVRRFCSTQANRLPNKSSMMMFEWGPVPIRAPVGAGNKGVDWRPLTNGFAASAKQVQQLIPCAERMPWTRHKSSLLLSVFLPRLKRIFKNWNYNDLSKHDFTAENKIASIHYQRQRSVREQECLMMQCFSSCNWAQKTFSYALNLQLQ